MTNLERKIILEALEERRKLVQHFYAEGKRTGDWKKHENACAALGAVASLADLLGVQL